MKIKMSMRKSRRRKKELLRAGGNWG